LIVSDSSPLIYFARAGRLDILHEIYGEVLTSEGVIDEVMIEGKPGLSQFKEAISKGWLKTERVRVNFDYTAEGIEKTDAELICLAKSRGLMLLSNDRALVNCARSHGVKTRWLTMSLLDAVEKGVLAPQEAKDVLLELVDSGMRVRSEVLARVMRLITAPRK
jgi:predicted nucleic acid-binding protein